MGMPPNYAVISVYASPWEAIRASLSAGRLCRNIWDLHRAAIPHDSNKPLHRCGYPTPIRSHYNESPYKAKMRAMLQLPTLRSSDATTTSLPERWLHHPSQFHLTKLRIALCAARHPRIYHKSCKGRSLKSLTAISQYERKVSSIP